MSIKTWNCFWHMQKYNKYSDFISQLCSTLIKLHITTFYEIILFFNKTCYMRYVGKPFPPSLCVYISWNSSFSPIQGLWTRSVRPSVRLSDGTITLFKLNISIWNFLHFFLKPNQELSSKMGKIGQNFIHVMGTSLKPNLGLWGKKIILSEWPEI
jgi:hypothetical protein